ncbi:sigma-70 family RNA polymerase sigma factor [Pedobacter panaciterrae]|uniref:Sigma-70 family RNA polymerase sigma factor n=1 Tax=Pedobacter panaciterrae TaxID=363849 RepID=A0ABU8NKH7_9SPHI
MIADYIDPIDDVLLWNSFLSGDKSSFQKIYDTYYQNLYSYGMRRINLPEVVRDCIQDLFIYLWTRRSGLGTTGNIKYYLLAALRNQLIQVGIRGDRWQQVGLENAEKFQLDFDPESDLIRKENVTEQAKKVIDALEKLSPRQKEVLYLHYFENMSHEDIAGLLDISVKGIYKVKYRGLEALRAVLGVSKTELLLLLLLCRPGIF